MQYIKILSLSSDCYFGGFFGNFGQKVPKIFKLKICWLIKSFSVSTKQKNPTISSRINFGGQ